ncbi:MAG: hypothetical protein ACT4QE_10220, partial [Anaerolineales bacterium]
LIHIYILGIAPAHAHGLLGAALDFEWVHFVYNLGLEIILIGLWLGYRRASQTSRDTPPSLSGIWLLTGLVVFHGYHSIEHMAKLYQYLAIPLYQSGMTPTPGILPLITGWRIFLVHFWLNTILWAGMVSAMWYLRPRTEALKAAARA